MSYSLHHTQLFPAHVLQNDLYYIQNTSMNLGTSSKGTVLRQLHASTIEQ